MKRAGALVLAALAGAFGLEYAYRAALTIRDRGGDAFELYAIGASTTAGEPYSRALSFPAQVSAAFAGRVGGRPVRLLNLARPGDSIYPQAVALAGRLRFRRRGNPAAVLIYSGHNEHFTSARPLGLLERAYLRVKNALLYRSFLASDLLCAAERRFGFRGPRTLADYERHLRRALEFSLASGATPILAVPVSNMSGVEPTLACPEAALVSQLARVRLGRLLEARAPRAEAARYYEALPAKEPCLAPLADFRLGKLDERAGDFAAAARHYVKARDEDPGAGFGRTNSEQAALLRRLAAEYSIPLVDADALFAAASPHGIVGDELMSDGHHPNLAGHRLLARAFSAALAAAVKEPFRPGSQEPLGPVDRAAADAYSGRWLLTVSVRHPSPEGRLALARRAFAEALTLTPGDARARWGLAVASADPKLLYDPEIVLLIQGLGEARSSPFLSEAEEHALALKLLPPAPAASRRAALDALLDEEKRVSDPVVLAVLAGRYRALGDPRHAESILAPARRRFAWKTDRFADLAGGALDKREYATALAALALAEKEPGPPARLEALYARLADEAEPKAEAPAAAVPASPPAQDPAAARKLLARLLDEAEAAARRGDGASARAALLSAASAPLDEGARLRISGAYRLLRDPESARRVLAPLARGPAVTLESAEIEILAGRPLDADADLASVVAANRAAGRDGDPSNLRAALLYQSLKEYGRAVAVLDRLVAARPTAELYGDRALCRHLDGKSAAAVADLERAVALDPDFLPPYLTWGAVLESLGRGADALAVYERALGRPKTPANAALRAVLLKSRDEARRRP